VLKIIIRLSALILSVFFIFAVSFTTTRQCSPLFINSLSLSTMPASQPHERMSRLSRSSLNAPVTSERKRSDKLKTSVIHCRRRGKREIADSCQLCWHTLSDASINLVSSFSFTSLPIPPRRRYITLIKALPRDDKTWLLYDWYWVHFYQWMMMACLQFRG
jgi:hypothetical protein